jgi:hypothetical protein
VTKKSRWAKPWELFQAGESRFPKEGRRKFSFLDGLLQNEDDIDGHPDQQTKSDNDYFVKTDSSASHQKLHNSKMHLPEPTITSRPLSKEMILTFERLFSVLRLGSTFMFDRHKHLTAGLSDHL